VKQGNKTWRKCLKCRSPDRPPRPRPDGEYAFTATKGTPFLIVPATDGLLSDKFDFELASSSDITIIKTTNPLEGGTLDIFPDGGFTYTPRPLFCGADEFRFTVQSQSTGEGQTLRVQISVSREGRDRTKPKVVCKKNFVAPSVRQIPFVYKKYSDDCSQITSIDQNAVETARRGVSRVTVAVRDESGNKGKCRTFVKVKQGTGAVKKPRAC